MVCSPAIPLTAVELSDCRGVPAHLQDVSSGADPISLHESLFESQILPAAQAHSTRVAYFALWRSYVSYAFIHDSLHDAIPATPRLLKGYMWFLLQAGYRPGTITMHLYAVIDRHRRFACSFPVGRQHVKAWIKAFERLCGVPKLDKAAVTSTHLKALLSVPRTSLCQLRDVLIVSIGTVCALRVSELTQLDVCDALFDFEPGILAIRVKMRKNDQKRAGLWPRIGSPTDARYDIAGLLREWLRRTGLQIEPACEKSRFPRSACRVCGRLFSRLRGDGVSVFPLGHRMHGVTPHTVRDAVFASLGRAGFPTAEFSGISMRRGGLTTALVGGVPSDLYELQSGHASSAWKAYVHPGQEHKLLQFYQSFSL
jgi:integrase